MKRRVRFDGHINSAVMSGGVKPAHVARTVRTKYKYETDVRVKKPKAPKGK